MPEIDHMVYKRRKRGIETSRDVSVQEVRTALQSSKSQTKEEILPKLDVFIEGVATIYQLLTAYKDVLTNSYDHCAEEGCMSVISNHLKEFAKKTRELDDQIKTKFLKDPELQVKTAEELVAEYNLVINRAETLLKGVSAKEGKEKLEIDSDILWKVFELDLIKLRFKKDQPIYTEHLPQLEKLEALVSQELTKAQEYAFKFPEYVEKDNRWNSILLNSVFQVKRIEEIFKARWHEIRAFMQDKDHTNHSFRNWMYYQGKLPTGLKAHDSGAAVFMIIENARQYMNILNECVSIEATTKTLHIDWDKMARMDLSLLSEQNQSSYWKNVIIDAHRKLHTSAMSMENKMRKLLGIHEQEEAARIARGEMDEDHGVESRGIYKKYNGSLDDSMLHLRNILSVPILEIVV
uniref:Uncharacterized protein n=1 Tax=Ditylenchus dipsaci TaxID=166011 RepID=A0A915D0T4_9BILA